jgi:hypothetical protein
MAIIKSFSPFQNLSNFSTFIVDRNPNSDFFRVTEFKEAFSGGKNGFLIEGSEFLKETTEVKIEILDVEGNPVYFEPGKGTPDYYEGLSSLVSVHVYPDTPIGIGKITILGELKEYINENGTRLPVPDEWKGVYNVKWERTFKINRNISNEDTVRFYRRPLVSITELVKPIFSKTIPSITQTGSLEGIALQPSLGSNLSTWTAGTIYKLKIIDGTNWTSSVDENTISIPSLGYSPVVREVLNNKEVLVDVPYSVNNIVQNFTSSLYQTTFEFLEGQTVSESTLTGSFARIQISNLKTFVGDVARVKVFRKSRNEVTDFQFVQESKLEASELLRDITVSTDTEISYGNFSQFNLSTYWLSSSNDHPLSVNVDVLQSSIKTDYNFSAGGVQHLITSESFVISKDVEYTLTFKTLISGSLNGSEYLKGYLSSSDGYQQTFLTISGSDIYKTRQIVTQNIIANPISASNAKLVFEISGSDWYISNVSLKNAQETSFSPDEFILVQDIPRKLPIETFDFRFEFYDINNNYIPVDVTAVGTFDGGNDFPTSTKILTINSDRNAFRFVTGSFANPPFQQIGFSTTRQNIVSDVVYGRSVFDITGSYISEAEYLSLGGLEYPGRLHASSSAGFVVQIDEFSGSLDTSTTSTFRVGFIVYTASAEGLEDFETIYRLEDGDNAPGIFASSTANQFIYKATDLTLNPSSQVITFDVRRKNLGTSGEPIIINSGSEFGTAAPLSLLFDDPTTGVATYFLSGSNFNFRSGSATYFFTASDTYDIDYHDTIKITPIKILDGLSVTLTNENASLPARSTGFVQSGSFILTSGSVDVKVGNETIIFDDEGDGQGNNTFAIISVSGSTGITVNSSNPTINQYGITSLNGVDSGSINVIVRYKDGAGDTTDISKTVSYSKSKAATPNIEVAVSPTAQSIQSNSRGSGSATPQTLTITALEGGTNRFSSLGTPTFTNGLNGSNVSNTFVFSSNASSMTSDTGTVTIPVNFTDSEGVSGTKNVVASVSRVRSSAPVVTISANPQSQTVISGSLVGIGTPSTISIIVNEGGSNYTYNTSGPSTFNITNVTSGSHTAPNTFITPTTPNNLNGTNGVVTLSYRNSEGTQFTGNVINFEVGVTGIGDSGPSGSTGASGSDGADGPGIVFRGPWSASVTYFDTDDVPTRRDAVLYSGTYYATLPNATTNLNKRPDLNTGTFWESLGTDSFFVAAEIAIFRESFVQNTINVGTNTSGNANITIAGGTTSPYISIGQSTKAYGNNGVFIGSNGTSGIMSLVGSGGGLFWDGSNLVVSGSGTFTGTVQGGAIVGGTINVPNASSPLFSVDSAGNVTATSATIGGWSVNSTGIFKTQSGSTIRLNSSANKIELLEGSNTRFQVSTSGTTDPGVDSSLYRTTTINNNGFVVSTDNERFFRHNTAGGMPIALAGKSIVFNDSKGGFRTDGLFFNTPLQSTDFFKFPTGSTDENDSLQSSQWLPRTQEAMIYDRPGISYSNGSLSENQGVLKDGGGITIGTSTFRVHTGTPVNDATYSSVIRPLRFRIDTDGNVQVLKEIQCYGNVIAYYSDKRLKNIIGKIENPLDKIQKLNGVYYTQSEVAERFGYEKNDNKQVGLIAQEVKEILPEVVSIAPFDKDGKGGSVTGEDYLTIDYSKVVPLLVECIKELKLEIEELKKNK